MEYTLIYSPQIQLWSLLSLLFLTFYILFKNKNKNKTALSIKATVSETFLGGGAGGLAWGPLPGYTVVKFP